MDSGWAVPTLRLGLSETVAAKVLTVAMVRLLCKALGLLRASVPWPGSMAELFLTLRRNALFLADESAGKSIAARLAMMAITISNSISVKARREGRFISASWILDSQIERAHLMPSNFS